MNEIIDKLNVVSNLINYIVQDTGKLKQKSLKQKSSKLEELVKPAKVSDPDNIDFLQQAISEIKGQSSKTNLKVKIEKEKKPPNNSYDIKIDYRENEREQELKVELTDEDDEKYTINIKRPKAIPDQKPYELNILYENSKVKEKLDINYNLRDYPTERDQAMQDFTNRADKTLHIMPKTMMGGILGFTYLGENFMARRDDLVGDTAKMVDLHEAIHTPDEYETRVLTGWMLAKQPMKYKR